MQFKHISTAQKSYSRQKLYILVVTTAGGLLARITLYLISYLL
jgi:hypothetical protein